MYLQELEIDERKRSIKQRQLEMAKRIFLREQVRKEEEIRRQKEQREQERTEEEVRQQNELNREIIIEELDGERKE